MRSQGSLDVVTIYVQQRHPFHKVKNSGMSLGLFNKVKNSHGASNSEDQMATQQPRDDQDNRIPMV